MYLNKSCRAILSLFSTLMDGKETFWEITKEVGLMAEFFLQVACLRAEI